MTNTSKNTDSKLKTVKCLECMGDFTYEPHFLGRDEIFQRSKCSACMDASSQRYISQKEQEEAKARTDKWLAICPPIYRDTEISRIDADCGRAAVAWNFQSPRGLGMLGLTGIGKTRAAFIALRRAFDAGKACRSISHNAFTRTVQTAFAGDGRDREDAKALLDGFQRCDVLLLDDLGKPPPTERADAELEELVEVRTCNLKPILWSANGSAGWLVKRMGSDRGEPLVRRLSEFCDIITVRGEKSFEAGL